MAAKPPARRDPPGSVATRAGKAIVRRRPHKSLASSGYLFYICSHLMTPMPLLDRVTGFIARVADRIAGVGDRAGRDQPGRDPLACDQAGLEPAHAGALLARLRLLVARFRAVAVYRMRVV